MWQVLKRWAKSLRRDVMSLWFAGRDPRTPTSARLLAVALTAYALSPIDLIPDFIPVLGYLDELILLPAGIWLCLRLLPPPVLTDARAAADRWFAERHGKPRSLAGAAVIVLVWLALLLLAWRWWRH
jgi:uncharacterized membrane protein YkvA (DUF1232 family)